MEKCNRSARQREKAFGVSFRASIAGRFEPAEGNVGSLARVKSFLSAPIFGEFRWYRVCYALSISSGRF